MSAPGSWVEVTDRLLEARDEISRGNVSAAHLVLGRVRQLLIQNASIAHDDAETSRLRRDWHSYAGAVLALASFVAGRAITVTSHLERARLNRAMHETLAPVIADLQAQYAQGLVTHADYLMFGPVLLDLLEGLEEGANLASLDAIAEGTRAEPEA